MFSYCVVEKPSFSYSEKILDKIYNNLAKIVPKIQKGTTNIVFLDDDSIQNLNNNYRGKDSSTDVLSFAYYENFSNLQKSDIIGEIILSESILKQQAQDNGLSNEQEMYRLIIHSLHHILGYDHIDDEEYQQMQALEDAVWLATFGTTL